jgi:hypothetical protein
MDKMRSKLKKIQKEIEEFQDKCNHQLQQIKFDEKNQANWYCKVCDKFIRMPSQQELDDWISS